MYIYFEKRSSVFAIEIQINSKVECTEINSTQKERTPGTFAKSQIEKTKTF